MILVNSQKANLIKYNRKESSYYDDEVSSTEIIKVVPYNVDELVRFGIYTHPEAKGYYMVSRFIDVRVGDQIQFKGKFLNTKLDLTERTFTVIDVQDAWLFNRVENKVLVVK